MIVSATSSNNEIIAGVNALLAVAAFLQPVKKISPPTTAVPVSRAIVLSSSLLSIVGFL
jgi:hypothetical protein